MFLCNAYICLRSVNEGGRAGVCIEIHYRYLGGRKDEKAKLQNTLNKTFSMQIKRVVKGQWRNPIQNCCLSYFYGSVLT